MYKCTGSNDTRQYSMTSRLLSWDNVNDYVFICISLRHQSTWRDRRNGSRRFSTSCNV